MAIYLYIGIMLFSFSVLQAQERKDTASRELPDFFLKGEKNELFNTGRHIYTIPEDINNSMGLLPSSRLLSFIIPAYLRQYGNGMANGISFRGTGSEHTALLWNGIPVSRSGNGIAALNDIQTGTIDEVKIQPGANSASSLSGAIGGTVLLNDKIQFLSQSKTTHLVGFTAGQPGLKTGNYKFIQADKIKYIQTSLLINETKNIFSTTYPYSGNYKNENAGIKSGEFRFTTAIKVTKHSQLSLHTWHTLQYRNLQQGIGTIYNGQKLNTIDGRYLIQYLLKSDNNFQFQIKSAWIDEKSNYYSFFNQSSNRYLHTFSEISYLKKIRHNYIFKSGLTHQWLKPYGDGISNQIAHENRTDLFLLQQFSKSDHYAVSINLRQPFLDSKLLPLCFDINGFYNWNFNQSKELRIQYSLGRSYRLPTLHERFWTPGGNRNLQPEQGYNTEIKFSYTKKKNNFNYGFSGAFYYTRLNKMIRWIPGNAGVWHAINTDHVFIKGIESTGRIAFTQQKHNVVIQGSYNLNYSTTPDNKQLIYTPFNIIQSGFIYTWNKIYKYMMFMNYTGHRFTTSDNTRWLDGYSVYSISIGRNFERSHYKFSINITCDNIFNNAYQTVENFAMPGRLLFCHLNFIIQ